MAKIMIHDAETYALSHQRGNRLTLPGAQPSPPSDRLLMNGETAWGGAIRLQAIHAPGCSPAYISIRPENMALSDDALFVGAVGRTDLSGELLDTLGHSIQHRLFALPDDTMVLSGHNYGRFPTFTLRHKTLTKLDLRF